MACFPFSHLPPTGRYSCVYESHRGTVPTPCNPLRVLISDISKIRTGKGIQVFLYYSFNLLFFDSLPELFRKGVTSELPQK